MLHNPYSPHYYDEKHLSVPYRANIPNRLCPGKQIFISGTVAPHAQRFRIDLQAGDSSYIHINPRFDQGCVVRNSDHGGWGQEERDGDLPFARGQHFEVIILVEPTRYRVAVNGNHQFDYNHRQPSIYEVDNLYIDGDVHLDKVSFSSGANSRAFCANNVSLPFSAPFTPVPGKLISIDGVVPHDCGRFEVDLQNGGHEHPNEIPLHVSVRFNDPHTPHPVVVRTNRSYGNWGHEEREGGSPFIRGSHFRMLILVEENCYKVAVNDLHFVEFAQRGQLEEGNHLFINGDVVVHSVQIH